MFSLSLRQPWADLVVDGVKTIETRTWNTRFRGRFLVHASLRPDREACERFGVEPSALGAVIGEATLVSVKEYATEKEWRDDENKHKAWIPLGNKKRYGFELTQAKRTKPRPLKGSLGFFKATGRR
jgi:predicted transcriptional regulator